MHTEIVAQKKHLPNKRVIVGKQTTGSGLHDFGMAEPAYGTFILKLMASKQNYQFYRQKIRQNEQKIYYAGGLKRELGSVKKQDISAKI